MEAVIQDSQPVDAFTPEEQLHESYLQLVWNRFSKSTVAMVGGLMVILLVILAIFAEFFSPTNVSVLDMANSYIPPQKIHFIDEEGNFSLRPFTYLQIVELNHPQQFG